MRDLKFKQLIESLYNNKYYYAGDCVNVDSGDSIYTIVRQDDLTYSEELYHHDPELVIDQQTFSHYIDNDPIKDGVKYLYGYNSDYDTFFKYNPEKDIHYFYTKSGELNL